MRDRHTHLQHNIHTFSGGWWLTRKASDGEYAASGKTFCHILEALIRCRTDSLLDDIESGNTHLDGRKNQKISLQLHFKCVGV